MLVRLTKQQEPEARKNQCCQLNLTVSLISVERRPRLAYHLRPTLSKPVAPIEMAMGLATMRMSSYAPPRLLAGATLSVYPTCGPLDAGASDRAQRLDLPETGK